LWHKTGVYHPVSRGPYFELRWCPDRAWSDRPHPDATLAAEPPQIEVCIEELVTAFDAIDSPNPDLLEKNRAEAGCFGNNHEPGQCVIVCF
jgi:hypothetical protein